MLIIKSSESDFDLNHIILIGPQSRRVMKCFMKKDNNASYKMDVHCIENTFVPDVSCHLT